MSRYTETLQVPESLAYAPGLVHVFEDCYISEKDDRGNRQKIGTSLVVPEKTNPGSNALVVVLSQWSEYASRQPQLDRLTAIAAEVGVPVMAIDMPGQSPNSTKLTASQHNALIDGNYGPLASTLWEAASFTTANNAISLHDKEIILLGMSQGGPQAAAMAAEAPEDVTISDVILWNSPSIHTTVPHRDGLSLAYDFVRYSLKDLKHYAELNPKWAYKETAKDGLRIFRRPIAHVITAVRGMANANDSATLYDPLRSGDLEARIHIVHSSEDMISTEYNNQSAEEYLKRITRAKGNVRRFEQLGEHHAITNHLASVALTVAGVVRARY